MDADMEGSSNRQKIVVVGAGPVGALAALYAATRGDIVEVYELRAGTHMQILLTSCFLPFLLYRSRQRNNDQIPLNLIFASRGVSMQLNDFW